MPKWGIDANLAIQHTFYEFYIFLSQGFIVAFIEYFPIAYKWNSFFKSFLVYRRTDPIGIIAPVVLYKYLKFHIREALTEVFDFIDRNVSREDHSGYIEPLYPECHRMFIYRLVEGTAVDWDIFIYLSNHIGDEYILHDECIRSYLDAVFYLFYYQINIIYNRRIVECYITMCTLTSSIIYKSFSILIGTNVRVPPIPPI